MTRGWSGILMDAEGPEVDLGTPEGLLEGRKASLGGWGDSRASWGTLGVLKWIWKGSGRCLGGFPEWIWGGS